MAKSRVVGAFALILLCLIPLSSVSFVPVNAQYQGHITINEDGTVSPQSSPISQNGGTYTLTADFSGEITICKSHVTFNGNSHVINQRAKDQTNANAFGILLSNVFNVTVANTTITNTGNGIYAIQNPTAGIHVYYGGSNIIEANNIVNNFNGISLLESNNNIIARNNITGSNTNSPNSSGYAIMLWGASSNKIYQNNFVHNESPLIIDDFNSHSLWNSWDNGQEGNYWDEYNGTDADADGIGDTPYRILIQNSDNYPLMQPFNSTLHSLKTTPPKISILSPSNQTYNESRVPLSFAVDKPLESSTYSLDKTENVTVAANMTLPDLPNGSHNITIYAKDTYGNAANQTVAFSINKQVPQPYPNITLTILAVPTAVFILSAVSVLLYRRHRKPDANK